MTSTFTGGTRSGYELLNLEHMLKDAAALLLQASRATSSDGITIPVIQALGAIENILKILPATAVARAANTYVAGLTAKKRSSPPFTAMLACIDSIAINAGSQFDDFKRAFANRLLAARLRYTAIRAHNGDSVASAWAHSLIIKIIQHSLADIHAAAEFSAAACAPSDPDIAGFDEPEHMPEVERAVTQNLRLQCPRGHDYSTLTDAFSADCPICRARG